MVLLLDTDVVIDYLTKREPHNYFSSYVLLRCYSRKDHGMVAFHTLPNIFYILRRGYSKEERLEMLDMLCSFIRVVSVGNDGIRAAIARGAEGDFEDMLQLQCAIEHEADLIITRNTKHYADTPIMAIAPADFAARMKRGDFQ